MSEAPDQPIDPGIAIDNGTRPALVISGVFEGTAGLNRGVLAFVPNRGGKNPLLARGALLDGEPVALSDIAQAVDGRSYTARFEVLA